MTTTKQLLKYIFQVTYRDGTIYTANQEDVSITDPIRSCFYDVKQDEVQTFFLFNNEHTYSVNLEDGHFEVDKVPFFMHEDDGIKKNFKLIFFRRHTHNFNLRGQELKHDIVYRFGWQYTDIKGKNHQRVMQIQ